MDEDGFDREGRDFREQYASERIGDRSVDVNQVEGSIVGQILMETDFEILSKLFDGPGVILAWVVTWKVRGGHIRDSFGIYAYYLQMLVSVVSFLKVLRMMTFRRLSSSADTFGAMWGVSLPNAHHVVEYTE